MEASRPAARRTAPFIDLHCHTSASFDSLADPAAVVRAAASRGLTHLAVTDHDRIDAALRARDAAPDGLTVIVGEEVKTADGDLIAVFIEKVVPPGLSAVETIAAVREQGGLVGVPHPFDRIRGYGRKSGADLADIADQVDWIEAYNARVIGGSANEKAAAFAREHGLPGAVRLRLAHRHGSRRLVQHRQRRPEHARRLARRARATSICIPTGPATTSGPGRRSPRSSSQCVATAGAVPTPPGGFRVTEQQEHHHHPIGRRARPGGGCAHQSRRRGRGSAARADVAHRDGCASRGRSCRSPSRWPSSSSPSCLNWQYMKRRTGRHRQRQPVARPARPSAIYYVGFPLRGWRWTKLLRGRRLQGQGQGRHRDPLPVLAGQLRRAGQARRPLPRLPAEAEQPRLGDQDPRHGLHGADPGPHRDRGPGHARRLLALPRQPQRPAASRSRSSSPWASS